MITENDKQAIHEIQGTGGFRVIEYLCKQKIEDLDKCTNINEAFDVAAQALGRKLAVTLLKEFLSDINILKKPESLKSNTYE